MRTFLITACFVIAGLATLLTANGLAVMLLWRWFAVPVFGLPELLFAEAIGISLLAGLLTHQIQPDSAGRSPWRMLVMLALQPAVYIAVGFVVSWFV